MAVDEEFFMFVTTHPSARQYLILTILCTLLADTFSRKRRLLFVCYRFFSYLAFVVGRRSLASHADPYNNCRNFIAK